MIKTSEEIENYSSYNNMNKEQHELWNNRVWVDREQLIKTISKINKELYDDEFGLYDWNELLLRELGVDE